MTRDFECVALIGEQNEKQMLHFDVKVDRPKFQLVGKFKHNHGFSANRKSRTPPKTDS